MNVTETGKEYITSMVGHKSGKLKVLLLDGETTPIVSMCTTQSSLLQNEVYLIDRIDNPNREKQRHLACVVFVRPNNESIAKLCEELRNPRYASYELYFSNVVKKSQLERLAESDDYEVVKKVQESFADFLAVNKDLFNFSLTRNSLSIYSDGGWNPESLHRCTDSLQAVLLGLKLRPQIRYDANSNMARKLAEEVAYGIKQEENLFNFKTPRDSAPVLLILDRKNDPLTPLLTPWSYQAMVHEFIGIDNNRVDLRNTPEIRDELKEIVLSQNDDPFFADNMYHNFGDLGQSIKDYVSHYQSKTQSNMDIESIADMKRFVEEYPEFRRLSGNVSKHVTLVGELSRIVEKGQHLDVSELEQTLVCSDSHNDSLKQIQQIIAAPSISMENKVRLVALYGLRYEQKDNNSLKLLCEMLGQYEGQDAVQAVQAVINFASLSQRQEALFEEGFIAKAKGNIMGLKGIQNVYTQHRPLLEKTLTNLVKNKLREATHPYVRGSGRAPVSNNGVYEDDVQEVVVFIVGGVTYEEARLIAEINSQSSVRIVLGGTSIVNSAEFIQECVDQNHRGLLRGANPEARLRQLI